MEVAGLVSRSLQPLRDVIFIRLLTLLVAEVFVLPKKIDYRTIWVILRLASGKHGSILRGGSWSGFNSNWNVRSIKRRAYVPSLHDSDDIGFRLVQET